MGNYDEPKKKVVISLQEKRMRQAVPENPSPHEVQNDLINEILKKKRDLDRERQETLNIERDQIKKINEDNEKF